MVTLNPAGKGWAIPAKHPFMEGFGTHQARFRPVSCQKTRSPSLPLTLIFGFQKVQRKLSGRLYDTQFSRTYGPTDNSTGTRPWLAAKMAWNDNCSSHLLCWIRIKILDQGIFICRLLEAFKYIGQRLPATWAVARHPNQDPRCGCVFFCPSSEPVFKGHVCASAIVFQSSPVV